jgi:isopentenyldiphosphate isomerase
MKEKVVVLRELQRAVIYTRELSKQAMEDHVSRAFTVYSVNEGARLTSRRATNVDTMGF